MAGSSVNWYKPTAGALKGQAVYLSNKQQQTLLGSLAAGDMRAGVLKKLNNGGKKAVAVANTQQPAGVAVAKPKTTLAPTAARTAAPTAAPTARTPAFTATKLLVTNPTGTGKVAIDAMKNANGTLVYHKDAGGIGMAVTHTPTGTLLALNLTTAAAKNLIAAADKQVFDWDNASSRKAAQQMSTLQAQNPQPVQAGPIGWEAKPITVKTGLPSGHTVRAFVNESGSLAVHPYNDKEFALTLVSSGLPISVFGSEKDALTVGNSASAADVKWEMHSTFTAAAILKGIIGEDTSLPKPALLEPKPATTPLKAPADWKKQQIAHTANSGTTGYVNPAGTLAYHPTAGKSGKEFSLRHLGSGKVIAEGFNSEQAVQAAAAKADAGVDWNFRTLATLTMETKAKITVLTDALRADGKSSAAQVNTTGVVGAVIPLPSDPGWKGKLMQVSGTLSATKSQVIAGTNPSGTLAYHKDIDGDGFTLTHVASGDPLATGLKTASAAQALAVQANAGSDQWGKESYVAASLTLLRITTNAAEARKKPKTTVQNIDAKTGVSGGDPTVSVAANVNTAGTLAYHKSLSGSGYTLTHAGSGYPIAVGYKTEKDAQAGMAKAEESSVDWSYTSKADLKANPANFAAASTLGATLKADAATSSAPVAGSQSATSELYLHVPLYTGTAYTLAPPFIGQVTSVGTPGADSANNHTSSVKLKTALKTAGVPPPPTKEQQAGVTNFQAGSSAQMIALSGQSSAATYAYTQTCVQNMDEAMDGLVMPYSFSATRSIHVSHYDAGRMAAIEVGDTWAPATFQAAKIDSPDNNFGGGGSVRIHYRIPKGASGIGIHMNSSNSSIHKHEVEFTVARATEWRVVAKSVSPNGRRDVVMEYIGKSPAYTPGQWDTFAPGSDIRKAKQA